MAWISNPRQARLYYVARGYICELCIYTKDFTIFRELCIPDNCYFFTRDPKTSSQQSVRPFVIKMLETRALCSRDIYESVLPRSAK